MGDQIIFILDDLYWPEEDDTYIAKIFLQVYTDEGEALYFATLELQPVILLEKHAENLNDVSYKYKSLSINDNINGFSITLTADNNKLTTILDEYLANLFWTKLKSLRKAIATLLSNFELEDILEILNDENNPNYIEY